MGIGPNPQILFDSKNKMKEKLGKIIIYFLIIILFKYFIMYIFQKIFLKIIKKIN